MEEKLSGNLWRGDFQSKYIEEITAKTGQKKRFVDFARVLYKALKCESEDTIFIDLLTYQDLENLKNK